MLISVLVIFWGVCVSMFHWYIIIEKWWGREEKSVAQSGKYSANGKGGSALLEGPSLEVVGELMAAHGAIMQKWAVETLVWPLERRRRQIWKEEWGSMCVTGWVKVPEGSKTTEAEASWLCGSGGSGCHRGVRACGHRLRPMCMMLSNLHGWKTLLSCCVKEACSVLTSHTKVSSLLSALPLVHHQCEDVVLLTCSALTVSPVPGEQLSYIQYRSSSNSRLILLHQNLNKNQVLWGKSNDFGQHKTETWKKKSQAGYRLCDEMLVLPTSNCFSVIMLWQLLTQSSGKTFCTRHDVFILPSAVLPIL